MSTDIQQKLMDISNLTNRLLRKNFGRGPDSCQTYLNGRYLVLYIKGFLSPMESILLEHGNTDNIDISRSIVMKHLLPQVQGVVEIELGVDVEYFYHDWNYVNNTGIVIVVFKHEIPIENQAGNANDVGRFDEHDALVHEVERISYQVEKIPDQTEAFKISSKVYLAKRTGIFVPIEKALIAKGHSQVLLVTKDDLEKSYLHQNDRFKEIFKQDLADVFVDWNISLDNSVICFVLK